MEKTNFEMFHDYGFEVPPLGRSELTSLAHTIHRETGYKGDRPFPIMRFVELVLPRVYEDFALEVLSCNALGEKLGETYPRARLIRLREDVYDDAVDGLPLARITVAHEVGHLIAHRNVPAGLARRQASKSIPAYRSSEWQANAFAGALLMPTSKIFNLTPLEIRRLYNVTPTAAKTQLEAVRKKGPVWARKFSL